MALKIEERTGRRFSWIWLVPVLALILFGGIAWKTESSKGPLVEIHFDGAAGMKADKTVIKHKTVDIGVVEAIEFGKDMQGVIVHARLNKEFKPYLGETTKFWIVQAQINGLEVSGLNTLLSGSYIEMDWSEKPKKRLSVFEGISDIPMTLPGTPGKRIHLTMQDGGSLNVGSSVFYKRLKVGKVESRKISDDFSRVEFSAFVNAPYDQLITPSTKFWNAAGLNVNVGSDGLEVQVESLDALVGGGVSFSMPKRGDAKGSTEGKYFKVYSSKAAASDSLFTEDDSQTFQFIVEFDKKSKGLKVGAPVELYGIQIGAVSDVAFDIREPNDPEGSRVYAVIDLQPKRIGKPDTTLEDFYVVMEQLVGTGVRAQLASSNLLTGSKYIKFVNNPKSGVQTIDFDAKPFPSFPIIATDTEVITQNVEAIVERLSKTPIDELVKTATNLLSDVDGLVSQSSTQDIPVELVATLQSFQNVAGGLEGATADLPELIRALNLVLANTDGVLEGLSPSSELYQDLSDAIKELKYAMRSIDALASTVEQKPNSLILGK